MRRADAGHHVFALRVLQELAVEGLLAGGRVAGEAHAGGRGFAQVAEHHGLHVDGGAEVVGNLVHLAVVLARSLNQERNTASRAPASCTRASCGNGLPVFFCTSFL